MSIKNNFCLIKNIVEDILYKKYRNSTFKNNIGSYIRNYINNLNTKVIIPESECNVPVSEEKHISKFKLLGLKYEVVTGKEWNIEISVIDNGILNGRPPYTYLWTYDESYFSHVGDLTSPVLKLTHTLNLSNFTAQITLQLKDSRNFVTSKTVWLNYGIINNEPEFEPLANIKDFALTADYINDTLSFSWDNSELGHNVINQIISHNRVGEVIPVPLITLPKEDVTCTLPLNMVEYFLQDNIYWFKIEAEYLDGNRTPNRNGLIYLIYPKLQVAITDITYKSALLTFPITIYNSDAKRLKVRVNENFGELSKVFENTFNVESENISLTITNLKSNFTQGKEYRVYYYLEFDVDGQIKSTEDSQDTELYEEFDTIPIVLPSYNVTLSASLTPSMNITASWTNDNPEATFNVYYKKSTETEYILMGEEVTSPYTIYSLIPEEPLEQSTLYNIKIETIGNNNPSVISSIVTPYVQVAPTILSVSLSRNNLYDEVLLNEKPVISNVQISNSIV